ncbi:BTB/POZ domain-containing protein [Glycine soja]|nr:BTB/POZ domain-containing protein [Glycine soja]
MTGEENLREVTESYFERVVGIGASMVLRSCVALLPEAETTASLASRCIEALVWEDDVSCMSDVVGMHPQDFQTVSYSLNRRLPNHDVLYKMVDLYLKENKCRKLTEEQKTEICNSIDCSKLSPHTLVNCVQNPQMPLRFIVQAILMEHLNTRRSVTAAATTGAQQQLERTTLREILQRDTADRQTTQIKETMDSTYSRIQSLEKELRGMKKILHEHHQAEGEKIRNNNVLNSERSASFHFDPADAESSKIQRGGRGSVSSSGFGLDNMSSVQVPCQACSSAMFQNVECKLGFAKFCGINAVGLSRGRKSLLKPIMAKEDHGASLIVDGNPKCQGHQVNKPNGINHSAALSELFGFEEMEDKNIRLVDLSGISDPRKFFISMAKFTILNLHMLPVFIDVPLDVCEAKDPPTGLYKLARAGKIKASPPGFTGIDDQYEPPYSCEIVIQQKGSECMSPGDTAEIVISYLEKNEPDIS